MIFLSLLPLSSTISCVCHSFLLEEQSSYTLPLLHQRVPFSQSAILQEQTSTVYVPYGVTGPPKTLLQPGLLSPWAHWSRHKPAPFWVSQGVTASFEQGFGSSMGSRWIFAPPWTSVGCRGTSYLTTDCREISVPEPGAPPPSPSSVTLVPAEFFHIFLPFFPTVIAVAHQLFPLLSSVMPEVLPWSLMGSAFFCNMYILDSTGIGSVGHRNLLAASHGSYPCTLPPPYNFHRTQIHTVSKYHKSFC